MARPPLENIDPRDIFMHALGFHVAEFELGKLTISPNGQLNAQLATLFSEPVMVLAAFTTELFLKCLVCLETNLAPRGHHLFELFEQLRPETQTKIIHLWDTHVLPVRDPEWAFLEANQPGAKVSRDLPSALSASSRAFEQVRYFYEPGMREDSYFTVNDLPVILHRVILEMKPEWMNLGRNLETIGEFPRQ